MAIALSHSVARPALLSSLAPSLTAFTQILRPSWSIPCEPSSSTALPLQSTQTHQKSWVNLIPSISGLLELFPPILLGTPPKKKTSRAHRGKGMVHRWLKNRTNIAVCEACGAPHLTHHICRQCYSVIKRRWKAEARDEEISIRPAPQA